MIWSWASFIIGMIIGAVALTCFAIVMAEDKIRKDEKPKPAVCHSCRNFDTCKDKPLPPGMQCLGWEPSTKAREKAENRLVHARNLRER